MTTNLNDKKSKSFYLNNIWYQNSFKNFHFLSLKNMIKIPNIDKVLYQKLISRILVKPKLKNFRRLNEI